MQICVKPGDRHCRIGVFGYICKTDHTINTNPFLYIIMRKPLFIGLFAVFFCLIACNRKNEIDIPENGLALVAYTESMTQSKTVVESGAYVFWETGDEISVFMGEKAEKFSTDITETAGIAIFKGGTEDETWPEDMNLWAVYPYSEDATFDGKSITTVLPSEQTARAGSFEKGVNLSIAHSSSDTLQFYNVGGGIKFSVTEDGIKKVLFEGLKGEIISGKVKIGFKSGLPVVQEVSEGSQFITLLPPEGQETFDKDTWYYIVAIPGTLDGGYKLRFYKDSDYARKVSEEKVVIKRSVFGRIEKADNGIEYGAQTKHFPETKEEITESIHRTHEIGHDIFKVINVLESTGNNNAKAIEEALGRVEGVSRVRVNLDERIYSIQQIDGVWINFHSKPFGVGDSYPLNEPLTVSLPSSPIKSRIQRRRDSFSHNSDDGDILNKKRKALVLLPFLYQEFKDVVSDSDKNDIPFVQSCLINAGFTEDNIDIRINNPLYSKEQYQGYADILQFTGESLSKYDLIYIRTHGGTGYYAHYPPASDGSGEYISPCTVLMSGTIYSEDSVTRLLDQGQLTWDDIAINASPEPFIENEEGAPDNQETHYLYFLCMTPRFLKKASFDKTCVILTACSSARLIENEDNSLIRAFRKKGVSVINGWKDVVGGQGTLFGKKLLQYLSFGFSYSDAADYLYKSDYYWRYCERLILEVQEELANGECSKEEYELAIHSYTSDILHYEPDGSDESHPYYLISPYPVLKEPVDDDGIIRLSWESNLRAFRDDWSSYLNSEDVIEYGVKYNVYVDGQKIPDYFIDNERKYTDWVVTTSDSHSWYVVSTICLAGNEYPIVSYQSNIASFSVTEGFVAVDNVSLDKTTIELTIGNSVTLTATVIPENATNKKVSWSSSNEAVAIVSSTGEVNGVAKGNAVITVTTEDGGKTATCGVTVKETTVGGDIEGTEEELWD